IDEASAAGGAGNDLNIKPIPYWENLFPDAAGRPNGDGGEQPPPPRRARTPVTDSTRARRTLRGGGAARRPPSDDSSAAAWFYLPHPPVRFARGGELDRQLAIQRAAAHAPQALEPRLPVRRQLHAGPLDGLGLGGRNGQLLHDVRQRRLHRVRDQHLEPGSAV